MPANGISARIWQPLAAAATFIVGWEFLVRALSLPQYLLPAPSTIVHDAAQSLPRLLENAASTGGVMLLGYAIAILLSIPLALAIASFPFLERTVYPWLLVLQMIPKVAIAPLFIVWFGFGLAPRLLIVFLLSFFPILINGISGFRSLDKDVLNLVRSTGASGSLVFWRVTLPNALPQIFTGLKVGAAVAATAAIIGEFVASDNGLGYLLLEFNGQLETGKVFAAIVILSAIGVALYYTVEISERLIIPWHSITRPKFDI
jgi:NitT/TauT family transport system permease protein